MCALSGFGISLKCSYSTELIKKKKTDNLKIFGICINTYIKWYKYFLKQSVLSNSNIWISVCVLTMSL